MRPVETPKIAPVTYYRAMRKKLTRGEIKERGRRLGFNVMKVDFEDRYVIADDQGNRVHHAYQDGTYEQICEWLRLVGEGGPAPDPEEDDQEDGGEE